MAKHSSRDLRLTGNGSAAGGKYEHIRVVGDGQIEDSVECGEFRCVGECEVDGSVRTEQLRVTGTFTAHQLHTEDARIRGEITVRGNIGADNLTLHGTLSVGGDCEAEHLDLKGNFTIEGLLAADTIDVRLYGRSRAKEIGGEKIEIQKRSKLSSLLMPFVFSGSDPLLTAETIEGDHIYLEHTKAGFVRGNHVTIGPGCKIGNVEYKGYFRVDSDSAVIHHQKI